jgi:hypothetical protein
VHRAEGDAHRQEGKEREPAAAGGECLDVPGECQVDFPLIVRSPLATTSCEARRCRRKDDIPPGLGDGHQQQECRERFIAVASLGNIFGSALNWLLGRAIERFRYRRWFPVGQRSLERAQSWYRRYGRWRQRDRVFLRQEQADENGFRLHRQDRGSSERSREQAETGRDVSHGLRDAFAIQT